jgi:DNA-binding XRE family transcriptional regulator
MSKTDNAIQTLQQQLATDCAGARISLDRPKRASGVWFLEISHNDHHVNVQWRADHGFGVSSSAEAHYGDGPDEIYEDREAVRHRVLSLLLSQGETSPPPSVRLAELRRERGLTQVELAASLGIQQGAVSRLETRGDNKISTLREYCKSLGGELQVLAKFPDGSAAPIQLDDDEPTDRGQPRVAVP